MAKKAADSTDIVATINSRIVSFDKIRADQITPHPDNPRRHPALQRQVVRASFDELGQIAPIVINLTNGYLVDGEERAWMALEIQEQTGQEVYLDAIYVTLSEEEHERALEIFDASGELAIIDRERLQRLIERHKTLKNDALKTLRERLMGKALSSPTTHTPTEESAGGKGDYFDATELAGATDAKAEATCIIYLAFPDYDEFLEALSLLTYGERNAKVEGMRFASVPATEFLERWREDLSDET